MFGRRSCASKCFGIKLRRMALYRVFLFVMANLMSSAQIERDSGAVSLELPGIRGSTDPRYILSDSVVYSCELSPLGAPRGYVS